MTFVSEPGADGQHITFCRICEAFCGLVATVKDGRVTEIAPDRDNPHSQGHVCVKGIRMAGVTHDPDRVTRPLKRVGGPGEFEPVSWDEALDAIAAQLKAIRAEHGDGAIASYLGNPTAFSTNAISGFGEFMASMGSYKLYGAGSQDSNARMVSNYIVHGAPFPAALPDLANCDMLLIVGANPLVSNGWMMCAPRMRHDFDAIAERGRVVVVDPRLTETAQRYEHLAIRPDGDAWLLLGMMRVIVDEGLVDREFIEADTIGWAELEPRIRAADLDEAAAQTGISADAIAALARDFATTKRAVIYVGLGLCRGKFGMLGGFLHSALNAITGRYGRPGGSRFGQQVLARGANPLTGGSYGDLRTRIGGVPAIAGKMACALLPADIEEEGEGQVRALIISAGNPVVSGPGGARLAGALRKLELMVALDFYHNETNRNAHYILPTPSFLERAEWPFIAMGALLRPFIQYTDAVIPPVGESRDDYWIYSEITRRMGIDAPSPSPEKQAMAREGKLPDPVGLIDVALRKGPVGDLFGERPEGWSRERLLEHPHGVLIEDLPDDAHLWRDRIAHEDGKLHLWHEILGSEFERLFATRGAAPAKLTLIGRRDIRSINSWMHNVDRLVRSQQPTLLVHPQDAADHAIADGDLVRVWNDNGAIEIPAEISTDVMRGVVSYPHGWGHAAGWRRANETEGQNMNLLLGLGVESVEFVSGMTLIDCLPVSIARSNSAPRRKAEAVA